MTKNLVIEDTNETITLLYSVSSDIRFFDNVRFLKTRQRTLKTSPSQIDHLLQQSEIKKIID